jgi:hypothetical protein
VFGATDPSDGAIVTAVLRGFDALVYSVACRRSHAERGGTPQRGQIAAFPASLPRCGRPWQTPVGARPEITSSPQRRCCNVYPQA